MKTRALLIEDYSRWFTKREFLKILSVITISNKSDPIIVQLVKAFWERVHKIFPWITPWPLIILPRIKTADAVENIQCVSLMLNKADALNYPDKIHDAHGIFFLVIQLRIIVNKSFEGLFSEQIFWWTRRGEIYHSHSWEIQSRRVHISFPFFLPLQGHNEDSSKIFINWFFYLFYLIYRFTALPEKFFFPYFKDSLLIPLLYFSLKKIH